jgi:hypothetical protein
VCYRTGALSVAALRTVAGPEIPDTPLVREATETARASEPIEILNHSLDTLLFAKLVAKSKAFPHDVETVYVAQSCTTPA